jgi:GNAT superfamily N-acetyltransferase
VGAALDLAADEDQHDEAHEDDDAGPLASGRSFAALVGCSDTFMAVAELPTAGIAGYTLASCHLTLFANGPVAWVEELMVSPDWRRAGMGESLMRAAEQWAAEQGAAYLALATRRAADLYEAIGYSESAGFFRKVVD